MSVKNIACLFVAGVFVLFSCSQNQPNTQVKIDTTIVSSNNELAIDKEGGIPIFYNMYLSVEMSTLFHSIGAIYNPVLINNSEKVGSYETSTAKALNLGVYSVDLCYAKYFEQLQQATKYLQAMHSLSAELGIPDNSFASSVKRVESNLSNKDSLIKIANEIYINTDRFLNANERKGAAALIIVGGWLEAMHIATNLVSENKNDLELMERIADQKSSLDNLIVLLEKYEKETVIKEYLAKLFDLKSYFTNFQVDTKDLEKSRRLLNEISIRIASLRKEIVS